MSELIEIPAGDRPLLERKFQTVDVSLDGRNIEMLCAPYDTQAMVADPPDFTPYYEEFARGAFLGATKDPQRVFLDFEHQTNIGGILGRGAHFEEADNGLVGHFRVLDHPDGNKALELIKEGVLTAASVFFEPIKSIRSENGVMRRLKVKLASVALCRQGAYPQAQVLAVRSKTDIELPRLPFNPDLAEYLSAKGITVPHKLRAANR